MIDRLEAVAVIKSVDRIEGDQLVVRLEVPRGDGKVARSGSTSLQFQALVRLVLEDGIFDGHAMDDTYTITIVRNIKNDSQGM